MRSHSSRNSRRPGHRLAGWRWWLLPGLILLVLIALAALLLRSDQALPLSYILF